MNDKQYMHAEKQGESILKRGKREACLNDISALSLNVKPLKIRLGNKLKLDPGKPKILS